MLFKFLNFIIILSAKSINTKNVLQITNIIVACEFHQFKNYISWSYYLYLSLESFLSSWQITTYNIT